MDPITRRNNLIKEYHNKGYEYSEIVDFLSNRHLIIISLRHLKRILKQMGLKRKNIPEASTGDMLVAVLTELSASGCCLGYRTLHTRLQQIYGLHIKQKTVLQLLNILDPIGIEQRKKHRLRRRRYTVPGPNFLWHLDGYDKLKPFGFAIHGCIDGFSRKILWLEVASSNNNPRIIASYYLNTIKQLGFLPTALRSDRGTENSVIEGLHQVLRFYHDDDLAGLHQREKYLKSAN